MDNEIKMLPITITGINSAEKKMTLLYNDGREKKAYFWLTKKDGTQTKANEQFQKFRFNAGDSVEIAVKEQERTFTNDKGKEITYTDRNIAYFKTVDENTPSMPKNEPQAPQADIGLEARVTKIEQQLASMNNLSKEQVTPVPTIQQEESDEVRIEDVPF